MSNSERFSLGNLIFLFVVAFLVGAITKKAVGNNIRIGFDDPATIITHGNLYDIDELEQEVLKNGLSDDISDINTQKEVVQ